MNASADIKIEGKIRIIKARKGRVTLETEGDQIVTLSEGDTLHLTLSSQITNRGPSRIDPDVLWGNHDR